MKLAGDGEKTYNGYLITTCRLTDRLFKVKIHV